MISYKHNKFAPIVIVMLLGIGLTGFFFSSSTKDASMGAASGGYLATEQSTWGFVYSVDTANKLVTLSNVDGAAKRDDNLVNGLVTFRLLDDDDAKLALEAQEQGSLVEVRHNPNPHVPCDNGQLVCSSISIVD